MEWICYQPTSYFSGTTCRIIDQQDVDFEAKLSINVGLSDIFSLYIIFIFQI